MTCVVALRHEGTVFMGCDSAAIGGLSRINRKDPKIYRVGEMLIGFTTSFRMGQLLGYSLTPPKHHSDVPVENYMATAFINAVRDCLKAGGWAQKEKEEEIGGCFLVAYKARLFKVYSDYQVEEADVPYSACGCGEDLALGSLHATAIYNPLEPMARLRVALEAAAAFSAGVYAPFRFEELK